MKGIAILLTTTLIASTAQAQDWTGFYAGGGFAFDSMTAEDVTYGEGEFGVDGAALMAFGGYAMQSGAFVFGPEIVLSMSGATGDDGDYQQPFEAGMSGEIRGRLGYTTGKMLPYLALGYVRTKTTSNHSGSGLAADEATKSVSGVGMAIGVDYMISPTTFMRAEYQHVNYNDFTLTYYGSDDHDMTLSNERVSVAFGMKF